MGEKQEKLELIDESEIQQASQSMLGDDARVEADIVSPELTEMERKKQKRITILCAIASVLIPLLGFVFFIYYWKKNKFRAWLCFGLAWIPTLAVIIFFLWFFGVLLFWLGRT